MKFNTQYSERVRVQLVCEGVSMTKQCHKDECDVNRVVSRYSATGVWDHVRDVAPVYRDVSPLDYHEAMNTVVRAEQAFDMLPALVRKRFENSPAVFLAFAQDPKNADEMVSLGLAEKVSGVAPAVPGAPVEPGGVPGGSSPGA